MKLLLLTLASIFVSASALALPRQHLPLLIDYGNQEYLSVGMIVADRATVVADDPTYRFGIVEVVLNGKTLCSDSVPYTRRCDLYEEKLSGARALTDADVIRVTFVTGPHTLYRPLRVTYEKRQMDRFGEPIHMRRDTSRD